MYAIVSIVMFFVLGIIWSKSGWFNLVLKIGFFAMAVWGLVASNVITLTL